MSESGQNLEQTSLAIVRGSSSREPTSQGPEPLLVDSVDVNRAAEPLVQVQIRLAHSLRQDFSTVWRCARRLGFDSGTADDLAQAAFIVLSQRLETVPLGRERAFLLSSVVKLAANQRRSATRRYEACTPEAHTIEQEPHPDPNPEQLLQRKQYRALLDHIMTCLPDEQQTVFVLYELEGMKRAEIAALLELPEGTVASRLLRGRQRFQAELDNIRNQWEGSV